MGDGMKQWQIWGLAIGLLVLGVGGYFGSIAWKCSAYEDDYLNAIASIRGNMAIGALVHSTEADEFREEHDEISWKAAETAMEKLYSDCSERAAQNAQRKGQDMLMEMVR